MASSSSSNTYGLSTLMEACEAHRKQHEEGEAGEDGKTTCITILQKLKAVLPKLLKYYFK